MGSEMIRVLPSDMADARAFATDAAKSAFSKFRQPADALLAVLTGRDLGLSPAQSVRAFHVIEGQPTLSADAMVAVALARRDLCTYFRTVESTDAKCTVETQRVGEPAPRRLTYTIDDAKRAGLAGRGPWQKHPSAMLRARAKAALARDVYPDLLLGIYDPSELADEAPAREREAVRIVDVEPVPDAAESDERAAIVGDSDMVARIAAAETLADLSALVPEIKALAESADVSDIRTAYAARKRELAGAA